MSVVKLFVFLLFGVCLAVSTENAVICYYGTWATYRHGDGQFNVEHIDPQLCTHLIYTFAGIDNQGNVISLDPYLDYPDNWGRDNFGKFNALKQKNSSLKTLLAVGGWNEGSAKYSIMAADPALRQNFITTSIELLSKYGFDGLDLDWEYPNRRDTVHGAADIDNFTKLLRELKDAFEEHGFLLTAAVSSIGQMAALSYDIPTISDYLDIINIMTYDMAGSWDPRTGHNAPLYLGEGFDPATASLFTVDEALRYWLNNGVPAEKIALGVPFYGNTFRLADPNVNGVNVPVTGAGLSGPYTATSGFIGYNELCYKFQTESWTKRLDSLAKAPYAFKDYDWVTYDDVDSITTKIDFARSLGITKVMIWSIETDDFHSLCGDGANPLLRAVNRALDDDFVDATVGSTAGTEATTTTSVGSTSTTSESSSATEASSTTSAVTTTTASPQAFICEQEGFAPNPLECTSFYRCIRDSKGGLVPNLFQCPAGLYWQQSTLVCNYPTAVDCNIA